MDCKKLLETWESTKETKEIGEFFSFNNKEVKLFSNDIVIKRIVKQKELFLIELTKDDIDFLFTLHNVSSVVFKVDFPIYITEVELYQVQNKLCLHLVNDDFDECIFFVSGSFKTI